MPPGERPLPASLLGRVLLSRYRILSVLGQGGWSYVFQAQDERLLRPVAVKVFTGFSATQRARDESRRNFIAEAYALSQLRHPNTLRIYDFGTLDDADDVPFQVSELMEGGTLAARIDRQGPLPAGRAVAFLSALAGAAHEAHGYGIVHRDIKPSNILFGKAGDVEVVKLADFSIAQTRDQADADEGQPPLLFCSLGWSAPEQARSAAVDRTVDVYGLALVFGYMLHGKRLKVHTQLSDFSREPEQHDRAVDAALKRTRIPAAFADVIRKATRARPEERLPSAAALLDAIEAAAQDGPVTRVTRRPLAPVEAPPFEVDDDDDTVTGAVPELTAEIREETGAPMDPPTLVRDSLSLDLCAPMLPDGRPVVVREVDRVVVVEGSGDGQRPGLRLRVTLLPAAGAGPRVHLRGLNCFLRRGDGPVTGAADLTADEELELVSELRRPAGRVRVSLGKESGDGFLIRKGALSLHVPVSLNHPVLVELLPDGDAFLLHKRQGV